MDNSKRFAFVKSGKSYGFVMLDDKGEYMTDERETQIDVTTIGEVVRSKKDATALDVTNQPKKTTLGWWSHYELYDSPHTFTVIPRTQIPNIIADDIEDIAFEAMRTADGG